MNVTAASIVAAHRSGASSPQDTVAECYARIRAHNDPAIFISLRDEADALAEAKARCRPQTNLPAALWRAGRRQGQHRRQGSADHRGVRSLRVPAGERRHLRCPAAARRCDRDRQDQSRSVRDRPRRRALTLWRAAQPVRSGAHSGRIEQRLGDRGRRRSRSARARHRHGGLRPGARRAQQHRRTEAEPRARLDRRSRARLPHARLRLGVCADGRRRIRGACGDGGPRSGRCLLASASARRAAAVSRRA